MIASLIRSRRFCIYHGIPAGYFSFDNPDAVERTLNRHGSEGGEAAIFPLLHMAQTENGGFLTTGCIRAVAELTGASVDAVELKSRSFKAFKLRQPNRHIVECCGGAACFVDWDVVHAAVERATGGSFRTGRSPSGDFSLAKVPCTGDCSYAPWVIVDGVKYVKLTEDDIATIIEKAKKGENETSDIT
jgi:NADH:ubiquinone oxidoreductase subunit E